MTRQNRVLFVGDRWLGSNARSMANGLREIGAEVVQVDTTSLNRPRRYTPPWIHLKALGTRSTTVREAIHSRIDMITKEWRPDVMFVFKGIHLDQERLFADPRALKVHYSPDDASNPVNVTGDYILHESQWNLVVTTKRHNVREIETRSGARVLYVRSAYDPAWHHPAARTRSERFAAGFIGNMRPDRRPLIQNLATTLGGDMYVAGPGWPSAAGGRHHGAKFTRGVYGSEFSSAIANCMCNLVLLNSANRDTHTCRSFEVPAAGGLFVGQRTDEHRELIEDGSSGFLFDGIDELYEIITRARADPNRTDRIAERGYHHVTSGRNTYADRAAQILHELDVPLPNRGTY